MTSNPFDGPPIPYENVDVNPDSADQMLIGRLRGAARRGDQRAKATLREYDRNASAARQQAHTERMKGQRSVKSYTDEYRKAREDQH